MPSSIRNGQPNVWANSNPPEFQLGYRRRSWPQLRADIRLRPQRVGWREVTVEEEMGEFAVLDFFVHRGGRVEVWKGKRDRDMFPAETRR